VNEGRSTPRGSQAQRGWSKLRQHVRHQAGQTCQAEQNSAASQETQRGWAWDIQAMSSQVSCNGALQSAPAQSLSNWQCAPGQTLSNYNWLSTDGSASHQGFAIPQFYEDTYPAGFYNGHYQLDGSFKAGCAQTQPQYSFSTSGAGASGMTGVEWRLVQEQMHQGAHPVGPVPDGALDPTTARAVGNWLYQNDSVTPERFLAEDSGGNSGSVGFLPPVASSTKFNSGQFFHGNSQPSSWRRRPPPLDFDMMCAPP
jgi:hypothetical protein